jgi:hypothetical protein
MAHVDYRIIDLVPAQGTTAAGSSSKGTPPRSSSARSTLTGEHLAAYVGA